jgi:hypothetical protein
VFIWVDKTLIWEIIAIMEHHGFSYIEHFAFVYLSVEKILPYAIFPVYSHHVKSS